MTTALEVVDVTAPVPEAVPLVVVVTVVRLSVALGTRLLALLESSLEVPVSTGSRGPSQCQ